MRSYTILIMIAMIALFIVGCTKTQAPIAQNNQPTNQPTANQPANNQPVNNNVAAPTNPQAAQVNVPSVSDGDLNITQDVTEVDDSGLTTPTADNAS